MRHRDKYNYARSSSCDDAVNKCCSAAVPVWTRDMSEGIDHVSCHAIHRISEPHSGSTVSLMAYKLPAVPIGIRPNEDSYTILALHAEKTDPFKHLQLDTSYE